MGDETGVSTDDAERLRRIAAVTDGALNRLDLHELLAELLERVHELLGVDTAAVLLLDSASNDLVATAAYGINEEVRQGVRVPVGQGFAGTIAATAHPVVIDDIDQSDTRNTVLRKQGIRSLLGVPLMTEGRVVGVMQVGSIEERQFGTGDIHLLQMVADRVALAVEARRASVDRSAAAVLQHSLVPARLPSIFGLDLAARYLPGEEDGVGGDWYDLFTLPSGHVGIVIGDVVGRGLAAAVVMGRLRSALRAYALDSLDPAEVLTRLDRKLQHFEVGQMTTVLYSVLDPSFDEITMSTAGHLCPIMVQPGVDPAPLELAIDPPLGVQREAKRRNTTVKVPPEAILALFTDGLVERRGIPIDRGIGALQAALVGQSAEQICQSVIASLVDQDARGDDIALLVARRPATNGLPLHLEVPAVPASLREIRSACRRWLASVTSNEDDVIKVLFAVGEASANAVEHAYGAAAGTVIVQLAHIDETVKALVRDHGHWRPPRGHDRGRGTQIMERCTESTVVDRTDEGTEVQLTFRLGNTTA